VDGLAFDDGEPDLDQIQPGSRGRAPVWSQRWRMFIHRLARLRAGSALAAHLTMSSLWRLPITCLMTSDSIFRLAEKGCLGSGRCKTGFARLRSETVLPLLFAMRVRSLRSI
jgi:hypothetical protein